MILRIFFIFVVCYSPIAAAESIHFDLLSSELEELDETDVILFEQSGLVLTLSTSNGVLNRTGSGFGVNANGSGDDTNGLDDGSGIAESITLSFADNIRLESVFLAQLGSSDSALLRIVGQEYQITSNNNPFSESIFIAANQSFVLAFEAGNGFSFNGLTVSTSSIPLPPTLFLLIGALGSFRFLRR